MLPCGSVTHQTEEFQEARHTGYFCQKGVKLYPGSADMSLLPLCYCPL